MAGVSSAQRTLQKLKSDGITCWKVEQPWNPHTKVRRDVFNFIDIIALRDRVIVGIQACSMSSRQAHRRKILANPMALEWLRCRGTIELWSWRPLLMKRGGKRKTWEVKVDYITDQDYMKQSFLELGE